MKINWQKVFKVLKVIGTIITTVVGTLAAHTTGSHVKVYNAPHFGSVYSNTMAEFLTK